MSHNKLSTQADNQERNEVSILWFKGSHQEISPEVSIFIHNLASKDGKGTKHDPIFVTEDGIAPIWLCTSTTSIAPHQCKSLGGQIILGTITDLDEFRFIIEQTDFPAAKTVLDAERGVFRAWMFRVILEAIKRGLLPEETLQDLALVPVVKPEEGKYFSLERIVRMPLADVRIYFSLWADCLGSFWITFLNCGWGLY